MGVVEAPNEDMGRRAPTRAHVGQVPVVRQWHRRPLDRVSAGHGNHLPLFVHRPDVAAVDVVAVAGDEDPPLPGGRVESFDLEFAASDLFGPLTVGTDQVEVAPAILFRTEHYPLVIEPIEVGKVKAVTVRRAPGAHRFAGLEIGNPDLPRIGHRHLLGDQPGFVATCQAAQECNLGAVRRPVRTNVEVDRGIEISQSPRLDVVDHDETVLVGKGPTNTGCQELGSVRRPTGFRELTTGTDNLHSFLARFDNPQFIVVS